MSSSRAVQHKRLPVTPAPSVQLPSLLIVTLRLADTDKLTIARLLAGRALALEGEGAWEQALTDYEEAQSVAVAAGYAVCASTLQLFNCSDRIIVCDRILTYNSSARHYIAAAKCALEIAHPSRLHIVEKP